MKTKTDNIKNLQDVRQRKLQLKAKMAAQRQEILELAEDLQSELKPANLLGTVTGGLLSAAPVMSIGLAKNIGTVSSFFIKDKKKATIVKWALPIAVMVAPKVISWVKNHLPDREDFEEIYFNTMRKVQSLIA